MTYQEEYKSYQALLEESLDAYTKYDVTLPQAAVMEAMRYSLLGGGKRVRAILVLEFCRGLGGTVEAAVPAACAIEMIHAYSLIHDDLPCMDDDDMRRGKPSNHKQFGESMAVLAGDGLLNMAFELLSSPEACELMGEKRALAVLRTFSRASGSYGMLGGQVVDVENEGRPLPLEAVEEMYRMKTGALIHAAVEAGCILAGADEKTSRLAGLFAGKIGLAFQVTDDILDITGDEQLLGKKTGRDKETGKLTYVSLLGLSKAQKLVETLTEDSMKLLDQMKPDGLFLYRLTDQLSRRKS